MSNKIKFQIDRDEDGFPPISVETLNAIRVSDDLFRIQNAPFFASNVSYGDIVKASPTESLEQHTFECVVEQSQFISVSIIILDSSMDSHLMDLFRGLGCVIEYGEFGVYRVLAVAVPATSDYVLIREQLQSLEDRDMLSFAELALPERSS